MRHFWKDTRLTSQQCCRCASAAGGSTAIRQVEGRQRRFQMRTSWCPSLSALVAGARIDVLSSMKCMRADLLPCRSHLCQPIEERSRTFSSASTRIHSFDHLAFCSLEVSAVSGAREERRRSTKRTNRRSITQASRRVGLKKVVRISEATYLQTHSFTAYAHSCFCQSQGSSQEHSEGMSQGRDP